MITTINIEISSNGFSDQEIQTLKKEMILWLESISDSWDAERIYVDVNEEDDSTPGKTHLFSLCGEDDGK